MVLCAGTSPLCGVSFGSIFCSITPPLWSPQLDTGNRTVPYFTFLESVSNLPSLIHEYNSIRHHRLPSDVRMMLRRADVGGCPMLVCPWLSICCDTATAHVH